MRFVGMGVTSVLGLSLMGCSSSTASYTSDADHGSTHAWISVERSETLGATALEAVAAPQVRAFASFMRTPPHVDAAAVARATGFELALPALGECAEGPPSQDRTSSTAGGRAELLDVGEFSVETQGARVSLALRAFPAVTDAISGVVYSTRDRTATLPANGLYSFGASGGPSLPGFALSAEAPPALELLTLNGNPLGPLTHLGRSPAELRWKAGSGRDRVYVTLTTDENVVTCAFRDDLGHGILPAVEAAPGGRANVSVHRVRSVPFTGSVDEGVLRFDFELAAELPIDPS